MSAVASEMFDAQSLNTGFAFVERLPATLSGPVLCHPSGTLRDRVEGVMSLRDALLAGEVPDTLPWPGDSSWVPLRDDLRRLDLARFARNDEKLVDLLILDLLDALRSASLQVSNSIEATVAELAARERARRIDAHERRESTLVNRSKQGGFGGLLASAQRALSAEAPEELSAEDLEAMESQAREQSEKLAASMLSGHLSKGWAERVKVWSSLADVFGDLRDVLGLGWDLSQGVLRHSGWLEMARLQELLSQIPALRELIRVLGRMMAGADSPPEIENITREMRRAAEEIQLIEVPGAPTETQGIERSGHISRMLPSEALLLTHPTLRLLWHARRAENALLTYRVEGTYLDRVRVATEVTHVQTGRRVRPRPVRGPILVCLDTSGSMQGAPERVAKAVTLECARVAYQERRPCHLYAFSGPGQVIEHTLDLSPGGLTTLLTFLTMSFAGGTDVGTPMNRAMTRLAQAGWERADVLLVTDGEFPVAPETSTQVRQAREKLGARFHGLLVGGSARAIEELCDPVHRFTDWDALGAAGRRVGR